MDDWRMGASDQVGRVQFDPDFVPRFRVPARRWWQFWKPRWKVVEGVSYNQIQRAYGLPSR